MNITYYELDHMLDNRVLYIDMDGVILHSVEAMCKILNIKYKLNIQPQDILTWNFREYNPNMTDKEIEDLFLDKRFFKYVKPNKNILKLLDKYRDKCYIITKVGGINNYKGKVELMNKLGYGDIPIIPLPLNVSKRIIDMSNGLFIDDSAYNLIESNADVKVLYKEYDNNTEWSKGWNEWIMGDEE